MYASITALSTTAGLAAAGGAGTGSNDRRPAAASDGKSAFDRLLAANSLSLPTTVTWNGGMGAMVDAHLASLTERNGGSATCGPDRATQEDLHTPHRADSRQGETGGSEPSQQPRRKETSAAGQADRRRETATPPASPSSKGPSATPGRTADAARQSASPDEASAGREAGDEPDRGATPATPVAAAAELLPMAAAASPGVSPPASASAGLSPQDEALATAAATSAFTETVALAPAGEPTATGAMTNVPASAGSAATEGFLMPDGSLPSPFPPAELLAAADVSAVPGVPSGEPASEPSFTDGLAATAPTTDGDAAALFPAADAARPTPTESEPVGTAAGDMLAPPPAATAADAAIVVATVDDGAGTVSAPPPGAPGSLAPAPSREPRAASARPDDTAEPVTEAPIDSIADVDAAGDPAAPDSSSADFAGGNEAGFGGQLGTGNGASLTSTAGSGAERGTGAVMPRAAPGEVGRHVATALVNGVRHIDIALEPAALGPVEVRLEFGRDGRLTALFVAETPAALDALRGEQRSLERALANAGVTADQSSLQFSLRDRDGAPNRAFAEATPRPSGRMADGGTNEAPEPHAPAIRGLRTMPGRLDIHA